MKKSSEQKAYDSGYLAARGCQPKKCPYGDKVMKAWWYAGYNDFNRGV